MIRYTKHSLKKLETLFKELDYTVRYERGNFQSGYCIVENRRIAIINKFYDAEARINCLLEILSTVDMENYPNLTEASAKFYGQVKGQIPQSEEEE